MKKLIFIFVATLLIFIASGQDASQIVRKAYFNMQGESQYAFMEMQIIRPKWTRTLEFKFASEGTDKALVLIVNPPKERGQTFLLLNNEMWMYNPTVNRIIKLGPAMLSQGWMGSDYSNDEILNEGSIVDDYNHKLLGSEKINDYDCWKIELTPKPNTNVVWGKQIMWIEKQHYNIIKVQLFDEDGYLVKTQLAQEIKPMSGRIIPTKFVIIPEENPDNKTILIIKQIKYNVLFPKDFFTIKNMRRGMAINFNF